MKKRLFVSEDSALWAAIFEASVSTDPMWLIWV